jgi:hypothetical protein
VAVCDSAHEELSGSPLALPVTAPAAAVGRGWLHWAVPDPVAADTDEAFETTYADLSHRVARLAGALSRSA